MQVQLKDLAVMAALHAALLGITLRVHSSVFGSARREVPVPEAEVAGGKSICLTIDDGPCADTAELLDLLDAHQAKAVFFLIGERAAARPEAVREILRRGHRIGNHTQTHPWLSFQSSRVIREQLRDCNHALEDTIGAPIHYLRPPHGARWPWCACRTTARQAEVTAPRRPTR